jgi:hypothetical protein
MPTSRFSPVKDQQIVVVCDSVSIATGDISEVLSSLKSLSGDRSSAMSAEGAVTLVFNGYDDDPRELHSIPEVKEWFAKLIEAWPYWSFFASRIDQTVPLVLTGLRAALGLSRCRRHAGRHGVDRAQRARPAQGGRDRGCFGGERRGWQRRRPAREAEGLQGGGTSRVPDILETLDIVAQREVWPIVSDIRHMEEADALHERLKKGEVLGRATLRIR